MTSPTRLSAPHPHTSPTRRTFLIGAGLTSLAALAAGCSSDSGSRDANTLKVAYQKTAAFYQLGDVLQKAKTEFEAAHKDVTIELVPIEAEQDQYFTKLALMNGSASTAPDVIYEDTFQIRSDAAAGYLLPIDDYVAKWEDWDQFLDSAKEAGLGDDGKLYGVSMGTDTRAIYFNKTIFAQAGLPADWQPTTWDEVLDAARTIKSTVPDVYPLNIFVGKAAGEQTTMQGFEMLLYGTKDTLYDTGTQKWVTGSQGFVDSLGFMDTVYSEGLGPTLDIALDASVGNRISTELLPQGKVAMAIDGSWLPGGWISGENAWPQWQETMIYPVRAIRRKNLGEFLLWAALADADELFAVSRAPQNPQEHAVYAQWVDFAAALRLPVQFALGERWAGSFQSLLQTAHVLMTTSVAEGFGLTFLEPWLAGRPLIGRKLPEITTAFERAGVDLTALYERLPIPLAWIDCECLRAAIQRELPRVYAAYGRSAGAAEVQRAYVAAIHDRTVDFGRLHEPLQQAVIQQLVNSPAMQAELRPYRNISAATACVQANCQQVAQCFNLQAYGEQLAQIYATVAASPLAPQPALNPQRLLDQFLSPERFCLLRT